MAKCAILVIIPQVTGSEACNCNYKPQSQAIRAVGTLAGTSTLLKMVCCVNTHLVCWYRYLNLTHLCVLLSTFYFVCSKALELCVT